MVDAGEIIVAISLVDSLLLLLQRQPLQTGAEARWGRGALGPLTHFNNYSLRPG